VGSTHRLLLAGIYMNEHRRRQRTEPNQSADRLWVRVGGRIRLRREQLGLTGWKAADALGVDLQSYVKFEDGERLIPADQLATLAQLLDVPVFYFFEDLRQRGGDLGSTNATGPEISYAVATQTERIATLVEDFQKLDFARQQCLLAVAEALVSDK
jgi:transcriptional regulator with XRE-family HTH domain